MNNINELIDIIKELNGEATFLEICECYQKKYKDSLSQAQKMTISQTLNSNKNLVFLNENKKWELLTKEAIESVESSLTIAVKIFKGKVDYNHIAKVENLRKQFIKDFPVEDIEKMSLNDFVFSPKDKGNNNSFCRRISYDLNELASVGNMYPNVFGIYNKGGTEVQLSDNYKKRYGSNYEAAFKHIKQEIVMLLNEIKIKNYSYIDKCELNGFFKYRLLIIYYGDEFIPVTANQTINGYCKALGMNHYESDSIINKNLSLIKIKNRFSETKIMSNFEFMLFCDNLWRNNEIINTKITA